MRVSLTHFVDFVIKSGSPKLTQVRTAKRQQEEDYDPRRDFWKPLRDTLVQYHREGEADKKSLDEVLRRVSPKKKERYAACLQGYKKFLGRKQFNWFDPPQSVWTQGELSISINPELGLDRDGDRTLCKLYFKSEKLSKRRVDAILLLMREGLRGRYDSRSAVGVIDVPRGRWYAEVTPDTTLLPLLKGEASSFAQIWGAV